MTTHTYVDLVVSEDTFNEIHDQLEDAGYDHCFLDDGVILPGVRLVLKES